MTMKWSFSYNSFVKLSLYNKIHLYRSPFFRTPNRFIKGMLCSNMDEAVWDNEVGTQGQHHMSPIAN